MEDVQPLWSEKPDIYIPGLSLDSVVEEEGGGALFLIFTDAEGDELIMTVESYDSVVQSFRELTAEERDEQINDTKQIPSFVIDAPVLTRPVVEAGLSGKTVDDLGWFLAPVEFVEEED